MAPLQKRALYSLVIGLALAVVFIAVIVWQDDVTALHSDPGLRLITYFVMVGVPLVYVILVGRCLREPRQVDERDKIVLERSGWTPWLATTLSLVVWTISLTEAYWNQGQMPVAFLNLILVSTLIVGSLAQSLGILLGYWRMNRDG